MKTAIFNNSGLKILALFLAIVTWYYIVTELHKGTIEERKALQSIFPYSMISKQLPIKLDLVGEPQKGYMVIKGEIVIEPSNCVMVGPKSILGKLTSVKTQPIDISGHSRMIKKEVTISAPAKGITMKEKFIKVAIPIAKVKD